MPWAPLVEAILQGEGEDATRGQDPGAQVVGLIEDIVHTG